MSHAETAAPKGVEVDPEVPDASEGVKLFRGLAVFALLASAVWLGIALHENSVAATEVAKRQEQESEKFLKIEAITVAVDGNAGVRSGPAPFTATFAVSFAAKAADGDPWAYQWSFGDGATSKEVTPQHTFKKPAEYTVRVIVTDDKGRTAEKEVRVVVTGLPEVPAEPRLLSPFPDMTKGIGHGLESLKTVMFGKAKETPRPPDGNVHTLTRGGQGYRHVGMVQGQYTDWFIPAESGKGLVFRAQGPGVQVAKYWPHPPIPGNDDLIYVRFYNEVLDEPSDIVVVLD